MWCIKNKEFRTLQVQCRPENLLSSLRAVRYSSSSSLESSHRSRSPTFSFLEVQWTTWSDSRTDHGSFSTSQSSLAGGVIEYVGGNDILTLLRREGMPLSVDAMAVDDVP